MAVKDLMPEDDVATVNYMTADAVTPPPDPTAPKPAPVPANALWSVVGLVAAVAVLARRRREIR
ncbi:hypothetical protein D3C81_2202350 [compost metagenome]